MAEVVDRKRRGLLHGPFARERSADTSLNAVIGASCLAFQGIACMSCRDTCTPAAICFDLAFGGARPRIVMDTCTGCGDCVQACPADAIQLCAREVAHEP